MPTQQDDPLDFWAALNGQDKQTFLDTQAQRDYDDRTAELNAILARGPSDPRAAAAAAEVSQRDSEASRKQWNQLARDQTQQTNDTVARLDPYTQAINQQSGANDADRAAWQQGGASAFQSATAGNAALFQGLQGAQSTADQQSAAALGRYGGAVDSANAQSSGALSQLQGRYDDYGILQANGYQGDAASNPEDIARQNAAYNQLGGWASGANDISSDPGLVAMQQGVYDDYGQFASGAMDLESQAATAAADAESVAAQKEALGEFRDRMDPKLTDAERFLYMQSRLAQEQSQRAVRDANYRELERRGMGGSTMALSNLNASSAEASNTRALQDLGANAKAVDRAEKALVNYGNLSSTIREQSFAEDYATKSAADRMAINNNQQRLAGIAGQGDMANSMRASDDAMRQGNANRQLAGAQSQGEMATSMRNAGDALNMFNKEQQGIQLRHEDDFNAQQQRDAWARDTGMADFTMRDAEGRAEREGKFADTSVRAADAQFGRAGVTANTGIGINRDYVEGYDRLSDNAAADRRDKMTELGAGSDSEARASEIAQRGQHDVNTTRQHILDSQDEDRRANDAIRYSGISSYVPPDNDPFFKGKQDPFKGENWA